MLKHDQERLEKIYPDGIPEKVTEAVDKAQKRYHANFGNGPMNAEMLTLITLLVDGEIVPEVVREVVQQPKEEKPVQVKQESGEPIKFEKVNWFATAGGTPVVCKTDQGDIEGELVSVFRKGPDKGLLKIKIPGSKNEFDTFHKSQVTVKK